MNWKDTVMNKEQLSKINDAMPSNAKYGEVFKAIADKQAEISFPLGEKQGIDKVVESAKALLEEIDGLVSDIEEDWTDPRYECKKISKLIGEWQRQWN